MNFFRQPYTRINYSLEAKEANPGILTRWNEKPGMGIAQNLLFIFLSPIVNAFSLMRMLSISMYVLCIDYPKEKYWNKNEAAAMEAWDDLEDMPLLILYLACITISDPILGLVAMVTRSCVSINHYLNETSEQPIAISTGSMVCCI